MHLEASGRSGGDHFSGHSHHGGDFSGSVHERYGGRDRDHGGLRKSCSPKPLRGSGLVIMPPKRQDTDDPLFLENLVDEAVLSIDPAAVGPFE